MTDLLANPSLETVRHQFEKTGHIFVPNAYEPDSATAVIGELNAVMRYQRPHVTVLGEQQTTIESRGDYLQQPHIQAMLKSLGEQAISLGDQALWPVPEPDHLRVTRVIMQAGVKGLEHFDCPRLSGVVAITTPEGESKVSITNTDGSKTVYEKIVPGTAVFLDTEKRLRHYAQATGSQNRYGIIVGRSSRG